MATRTGPLPTRDALLSRILRTGQPVQDTRRTHELDTRMQNKIIYWYAAANAFPRYHLKHAHYLRLLEKFAEFREDQETVNAAEEKLRSASIPAADNDLLVAHHLQVWQRHRLAKWRREIEVNKRIAAANEEERQRALRAAGLPVDVTRPASPIPCVDDI